MPCFHFSRRDGARPPEEETTRKLRCCEARACTTIRLEQCKRSEHPAATVFFASPREHDLIRVKLLSIECGFDFNQLDC